MSGRPPRTAWPPRTSATTAAGGAGKDRGSRARTAKSAGPPISRVADGGQETPSSVPSGTTNAPRKSTTSESPREMARTWVSVPSASTVPSAQAIAECAGCRGPGRIVAPTSSV